MFDQLSITNDILPIAYKAYFEEHNRIDGFLTTFAIIGGADFIQKPQVNYVSESFVEAVFGYRSARLKVVNSLG